MPDYGTTPISSLLGVRADELPPVRRLRVGVARTARAIARLARAHNRLAHLPTVGQVRAMAWFDGREPCSYLLDPEQNFVPEPMEFGYERELGSACAVLHLPQLPWGADRAGDDARRRRVQPALTLVASSVGLAAPVPYGRALRAPFLYRNE